VQRDLLPDAARDIHFNRAGIGQIHAEHGFYGIMKLTFREEYEWLFSGVTAPAPTQTLAVIT
jgi:hypothetical protein